MTKICISSAHHADERSYFCASTFDAYSPNPISAKKPETPEPNTESVEEALPTEEIIRPEKIDRKRTAESKDDKENVPTKIRKKNGFDKRKGIIQKKTRKVDKRKNGKIIKARIRRKIEIKSRCKRVIRKTTEAELYKNVNPVRYNVSFNSCDRR
jgi:hypothetical protein